MKRVKNNVTLGGLTAALLFPLISLRAESPEPENHSKYRTQAISALRNEIQDFDQKTEGEKELLVQLRAHLIRLVENPPRDIRSSKQVIDNDALDEKKRQKAVEVQAKIKRYLRKPRQDGNGALENKTEFWKKRRAGKIQAMAAKKAQTDREEEKAWRAYQKLIKPGLSQKELLKMRSQIAGMEGNIPVTYSTNSLAQVQTVSSQHLSPGGSLGLNLNGAGVTVGIWDLEDIHSGHQEFSGTGGAIVDMDGSIGLGSHATEVCGVIKAEGVAGGGSAVGHSPNTIIHGYDILGITSELTSIIGLMAYRPLDEYMNISNHSYSVRAGWELQLPSTWFWKGDPTLGASESNLFGKYGRTAQFSDVYAFGGSEGDHLMVKAAGNARQAGFRPPSRTISHFELINGSFQSVNTFRHYNGAADNGFDTLDADTSGKNLLLVGNVNPLTNGYQGAQSVTISPSSAIGPTDDGRIKPDIVACGVNVIVPSWPSQYQIRSGTSQSCPSVVGVLSLWSELYETAYSGTRSRPLASTMKALALHTADECGSAPGPDYIFGWGLLNARTGAQVILDDASSGSNTHIKEFIIDGIDGIHNRDISVPIVAKGGEPLVATICWMEGAGDRHSDAIDDNTPVIVYDCNIAIVETSSSTVHFPWTLDPANPASPAVRTKANSLDTVEQVQIDNPVAGATYIISISADALNSSASERPNHLSLIVTGNELETDVASIENGVRIIDTNAQSMFVEWDARPGQHFRVESSSNLQFWFNAAGYFNGLTAYDDKIILELPFQTTRQKQFYRVSRVKRPLMGFQGFN